MENFCISRDTHCCPNGSVTTCKSLQ